MQDNSPIYRKAFLSMLAFSSIPVLLLSSILIYIQPLIVLPISFAYLIMILFILTTACRCGRHCTASFFLSGLFGVATYAVGVATVFLILIPFRVFPGSAFQTVTSFAIFLAFGFIPAFLVGMTSTLSSRPLPDRRTKAEQDAAAHP